MAQSILIFNFGTNEEAAQQARHKIEAWQQGFRLGKKLSIKFDREEPAAAEAATAESAAAEKGKPAKREASAGKASGDERANDDNGKEAGVRVLVRLDFSDHEKLTQQRWLERIPAEEPFKSAKGETVRQGDPAFAETAEFFESLD